MPLNIDNLLPHQRPEAGNDVAVQWGQAVEEDLRDVGVKAENAVETAEGAEAAVAAATAAAEAVGNRVDNLEPLLWLLGF